MLEQFVESAIPFKAICHIDMWKLCPCALTTSQLLRCKASKVNSRKRDNLDKARWETDTRGVDMLDREGLRYRVVLQTCVQNLGQMVAREPDVNFELLHVAWVS